MHKIVAGTTPTITYSFSKVKPSDITVAVLTAKRRGAIVLEKTPATATVTDAAISWTLAQEETLDLGLGEVEIMLNWIDSGGKRGVGKIIGARVIPNHVNEVME